MKNVRGFFNWQGNQLDYTKIGNYIVISLIIISLAVSVIFKKKLINFFKKKETEKILFFKDINSLLQVMGGLIVIAMISRTAILITYSYPLYYEYIPLHLCRFHFLLMGIFLLIRKKELCRYIVYLSFVASIAGMLGKTAADIKPTLDKPSNIFWDKGFKFYEAGPDAYFYWDYHITHLITGILPVVLTIGLNKEKSIINFYRTLICYISLAIFVFIINIITNYSEEWGWQSNYWYVGMDKNNDFKEFLGPLTSWPYNIISFIVGGTIVMYAGKMVSLVYRGNFKKNFKKFIKDHKNITFKQLFNIV